MRHESIVKGLMAGAAALLLTTALPLQAQPRASMDRKDDSGIGVARITTVQGDASRRHGEHGDLVSAESGMPVVGGDTVKTGAGGRVELRLDRSNYLRLAPDSEVKLRQMGERAYQIDVIRGTVAYTMMKYGEADVDLRTPESNVVPHKAGVYRVVVPDEKSWMVAVRKGEAEVLTPDNNIIVKKGKMAESRAYEHGKKAGVTSAPSRDGFDEWVARRDQILESERGPVYARGWAPGYIHAGYGWGWPYWDPFWGYYGGYYGWGGPRVVVATHFGGGGRGGHRR